MPLLTKNLDESSKCELDVSGKMVNVMSGKMVKGHAKHLQLAFGRWSVPTRSASARSRGGRTCIGFKCRNENCIPLSKVCNHGNDCGDDSDEPIDICDECGVFGRKTCDDYSKCLLHEELCDGVAHCKDASDEARCTGNHTHCKLDEFDCRSGAGNRCIPSRQVCDGTPHCSNNRDETVCRRDDLQIAVSGSPNMFSVMVGRLVNCLSEQIRASSVASDAKPSESKEPSKTEINILKNSRWGDAPLTPSAGNVADIFWPVEPMKKLHRPATPTLNQVNIETKSSVKGIVGRKLPLNLVIAANKAVTKQKFYHIGNVARCTKNNIVEYLKSLDVETVSCFPVFKKSDKETKTPVLKKDGNEENLSTDETKPTSSDKSTSFRLCVDVKFANVIEDMDSWPEHNIYESMAIEVNIGLHFNIVVIVFYRPPDSDPLTVFDHFFNVIKNCRSLKNKMRKMMFLDWQSSKTHKTSNAGDSFAVLTFYFISYFQHIRNLDLLTNFTNSIQFC
ncbi:hypothetical protein HELRODRAFT_158698 [Helobdella robusta]|uniref:Uncharacterized protein n=1 Tax=Helobdella robusta TaxID=6412 RepID=T1EN50_HELRO|nr:hypothetical protein HELRODRAFT_158698 [Helobdella robusta]ESO12229.1 hypothetical protein HELRODRAFT_158698 [Helobdella robusta]